MPLANHAFVRVTPAIFVIFIVSRGLSSKTLVRGCRNTAFGKPSFCLGETIFVIFVIFVDFRGLRSKISCFCRSNALSKFAPIFVKTTCSRHRFPNDRFDNPDLFYQLERKFVIFAVFVENPLFLMRQRHGLPKAPFLGPRLLRPGTRTQNATFRLKESVMCTKGVGLF